MEMIRMFIGMDQAESVAWNVFNYSIHRRASQPVMTMPIWLRQLPMLHRPRTPEQSNEFSFSRWLVPYLIDYDGWAIFADCDMLCRVDIAELWAKRDDRYAVMCVKHDHKPQEIAKYLGTPQKAYPYKNWSSVMLINGAKCKALTPEYVNSAENIWFEWLEDDSLIGELPKEWNHLVGYDEPNPDAKIAHFTLGGPYFMDHVASEFAAEWSAEHRAMNHCAQIMQEPVI